MFYTKTTIKFKMFHHLQGLISGHQGRLSTEHSCQSFGGRTSTTINVGIRDRIWCFKLCTSRLHIIFRYYIYCPIFCSYMFLNFGGYVNSKRTMVPGTIYPLLKGVGNPQITHDFSHFRPDPNGQPGHSMSKRRTPKPERCANCGWAFISSSPTSKKTARSEMCRLFFSPVSRWWFHYPTKKWNDKRNADEFDEV